MIVAKQTLVNRVPCNLPKSRDAKQLEEYGARRREWLDFQSPWTLESFEQRRYTPAKIKRKKAKTRKDVRVAGMPIEDMPEIGDLLR